MSDTKSASDARRVTACASPPVLNALTVDLEEWFQVSNFQGVIARDAWDALPSRVEDSTRRLLDAFDETSQRATFFVLGQVAERHPRLVREIADRGHEIACHGQEHDLVYDLGPERFRADLRRSRAAIEAAAGRRLEGYRAPSYSITRASLWALPILVEEGFTFDSSIFPVHHHRYGIPDFDRVPVRIELPSGASLLEFPLTTLPIGPLAFPLAGGAYLRLLPARFFQFGFAWLIRRGTPTILYLHPWEIDPDQPRQDVSRRIRWNHYHGLDRMERKLRALLERFRFTTAGNVLRSLDASGRISTRRLDLSEPSPGTHPPM